MADITQALPMRMCQYDDPINFIPCPNPVVAPITSLSSVCRGMNLHVGSEESLLCQTHQSLDYYDKHIRHDPSIKFNNMTCRRGLAQCPIPLSVQDAFDVCCDVLQAVPSRCTEDDQTPLQAARIHIHNLWVATQQVPTYACPYCKLRSIMPPGAVTGSGIIQCDGGLGCDVPLRFELAHCGRQYCITHGSAAVPNPEDNQPPHDCEVERSLRVANQVREVASGYRPSNCPRCATPYTWDGDRCYHVWCDTGETDRLGRECGGAWCRNCGVDWRLVSQGPHGPNSRGLRAHQPTCAGWGGHYGCHNGQGDQLSTHRNTADRVLQAANEEIVRDVLLALNHPDCDPEWRRNLQLCQARYSMFRNVRMPLDRWDVDMRANIGQLVETIAAAVGGGGVVREIIEYLSHIVDSGPGLRHTEWDPEILLLAGTTLEGAPVHELVLRHAHQDNTRYNRDRRVYSVDDARSNAAADLGDAMSGLGSLAIDANAPRLTVQHVPEERRHQLRTQQSTIPATQLTACQTMNTNMRQPPAHNGLLFAPRHEIFVIQDPPPPLAQHAQSVVRTMATAPLNHAVLYGQASGDEGQAQGSGVELQPQAGQGGASAASTPLHSAPEAMTLHSPAHLLADETHNMVPDGDLEPQAQHVADGATAVGEDEAEEGLNGPPPAVISSPTNTLPGEGDSVMEDVRGPLTPPATGRRLSTRPMRHTGSSAARRMTPYTLDRHGTDPFEPAPPTERDVAPSGVDSALPGTPPTPSPAGRSVTPPILSPVDRPVTPPILSPVDRQQQGPTPTQPVNTSTLGQIMSGNSESQVHYAPRSAAPRALIRPHAPPMSTAWRRLRDIMVNLSVDELPVSAAGTWSADALVSAGPAEQLLEEFTAARILENVRSMLSAAVGTASPCSSTNEGGAELVGRLVRANRRSAMNSFYIAFLQARLGRAIRTWEAEQRRTPRVVLMESISQVLAWIQQHERRPDNGSDYMRNLAGNLRRLSLRVARFCDHDRMGYDAALLAWPYMAPRSDRVSISHPMPPYSNTYASDGRANLRSVLISTSLSVYFADPARGEYEELRWTLARLQPLAHDLGMGHIDPAQALERLDQLQGAILAPQPFVEAEGDAGELAGLVGVLRGGLDVANRVLGHTGIVRVPFRSNAMIPDIELNAATIATVGAGEALQEEVINAMLAQVPTPDHVQIIPTGALYLGGDYHQEQLSFEPVELLRNIREIYTIINVAGHWVQVHVRFQREGSNTYAHVAFADSGEPMGLQNIALLTSFITTWLNRLFVLSFGSGAAGVFFDETGLHAASTQVDEQACGIHAVQSIRAALDPDVGNGGNRIWAMRQRIAYLIDILSILAAGTDDENVAAAIVPWRFMARRA